MQPISQYTISSSVPLNGLGSSASCTGGARVPVAARIPNEGAEVSGGDQHLETTFPAENGDIEPENPNFSSEDFAWMDISSSRSESEHSDDSAYMPNCTDSSSSESTPSSVRDEEEFSPPEAVSEGRKKTKAGVRIASENMRGRGTAGIGGNIKWQKISNSMREEKIGIMALMETHLTERHIEDIHHLHKHLRVLNSASPDNPSGAGGVAIVLNRRMTNADDVEVTEVVPGRVIVVDMKWHRDARLCLMAVYAPTEPKANREMWEKVRKALKRKNNRPPKPDILLRDFNFVEDAVDRFPAKLNKIDAPETFDRLKGWLKMVDGWRDTNPGTVEWTWRNSTRSAMSRIDRIYLTQKLLRTSRQWDIKTSELTTNDHSRISVEVAHLEMPEIGSGRWSMQESLTRDKKFLAKANDLGLRAAERLTALKGEARSQDENPQTVWREFKAELIRTAKLRAREIASSRKSKIEKFERDRESAKLALRVALLPEEVEEAKKALRTAEKGIFDEKDKKHERTMQWRRAKANEDAERMTKSWFSWSREQKPRDTLFALRRLQSEPPNYATDSKTMADIARAHHEEVQSRDLDACDAERADAMEQALDHIEPRLTDEERQYLGADVDREAVAESLRSTKNGSAPGLDGIIYELWKVLHRLYETSITPVPYACPRWNDPFDEIVWCDILEVMTAVFKDIEEFGLIPDSTFAEGWLCPLYKKGDRTEIANYRPITLLNTDYKIYTKFLSLRIAKIAPRIVHESQAGFVRGRSITDQTKLTSLMLDYAEVMEENGAIIALDQEKAYDRVRHDYLPRVLERYGFPEKTIKTIMSLYSEAWTSVMVNGHLSRPFKITRGVRQGDPLSCLLFDLAIEPLSAMLRSSDLRGFEIYGMSKKLIASLYADDTTVYLSEYDSYDDLIKILDTWCLASGARFNIKKTEVIPLGVPAYRERLARTAELREGGPKIPENVRIAKDGETTRILGAWPGNNVEHAQTWSRVLEKVEGLLERWERAKPTLNGRALISQSIIGGCTQYLTAAQGMPDKIVKKLETMTLDFMWGGSKHHPVNMATIRGEKSLGGLGAFCATERNDAQYLVWIGAYIDVGDHRPLWCYLADVIFRCRVIGDHEIRIR